MRRLALILLAALSSAACSTARTPFSDGQTGGQTIRVEVRNLNFDPATVWAVRSGERIRLGIVEGKLDRTFRVPWPNPSSLQIEVALQGGGRCITRAVPVNPGETMVMDVASDLQSDPECT